MDVEQSTSARRYGEEHGQLQASLRGMDAIQEGITRAGRALSVRGGFGRAALGLAHRLGPPRRVALAASAARSSASTN